MRYDLLLVLLINITFLSCTDQVRQERKATNLQSNFVPNNQEIIPQKPIESYPQPKDSFANQSIENLLFLKNKKENEIVSEGSNIKEVTKQFEEHFKQCPEGSIPFVKEDIIKKIESRTAEDLGKNLLESEIKDPPQSNSKKDKEGSGNDSGAKSSLEWGWYSDTINWGVINLFVGIGVIGGVIVNQYSDKFTDPTIKREYNNWKERNPKGTIKEFTKHIEAKKLIKEDFEDWESKNVSKAYSEYKMSPKLEEKFKKNKIELPDKINNEIISIKRGVMKTSLENFKPKDVEFRSKAHTTGKWMTGIGGLGTLVSAGLMISAGISSAQSGLTEDVEETSNKLDPKITQCKANEVFRRKIFEFFSKVRSLKIELSYIEAQLSLKKDMGND